MTEEPRQPGPGNMPPDQPPPPSSGSTQPDFDQPGYAPPGTTPPDYGQPGFAQPSLGTPAAGDPSYSQPDLSQPDPGQPGYIQPGYTQPGDSQPGHGQPDASQSGWAPPAPGRTSLQNFDPKSVNPLDWGIIAAGLVTLLFSLFNYFTYKVEIATFSRTISYSAWHGALAPTATVLALAAAVLLAVHVIGGMQLAFPVRLVVLAAFALASLLLLLALFVMPGASGGAAADALGVKVDKGHGIGYWISLLAVLAGAGLSFKRFTETGGTLPTRS